MAILSASRRTDIPTFYGDWFMNRLREGFFMVRNPFNNKASKVCFRKEDIDCIVFWTKNPIPFMKHLPELNETGIPYYFQFTLTGYGRDMEANLPDKQRLAEAFKELHDKGNGHIIWRYDPIMFTPCYSTNWHLQKFRLIAKELQGYTDKVVISFLDIYPQISLNMNLRSPLNMPHIHLNDFARQLAEIAAEYGMTVATCAEHIDLASCGIEHNKCIDDAYISRITGKQFSLKKDAGQRPSCGCVESIEVGAYSTCRNGCKYCYANKDCTLAATAHERYDADSPLLCDTLKEGETFTEKHLKSLYREPEPEQFTLF